MIDTATEDSDEKILEIPAPKNKPVENDSKPDISTMTHIYFDIEATGLGKKGAYRNKTLTKEKTIFNLAFRSILHRVLYNIL